MNLFDIPSKNEKIDKLIKKIGEIADEYNYEVYIVGGFIRDRILGREKSEIDFSVIGDSIEFSRILKDIFNIDKLASYRRFGTNMMMIDDIKLEFVSARKESYSKDSRKPEVFEGSFEDDIRRRDFTINALACSINKNNFGEIIDKFDGINDIKRRIIRTPLDPYETFSDDPLRIIRAFRFASELNFEIDNSIFNAAYEMRERLQIVAYERIVDEFFKIILSDNPSVGLGFMYKTKVMEFLFPEIANMGGIDQRKDFHHKDVFWHTMEVLDNISKMTDNLWLRLTALFHDIAKPATKNYVEGIGWTFYGHEKLGAKMVKALFHKYKFPLYKIDYISKLIRLHLRPMALTKENVTDSAVRRLIVDAGEELDDLIMLCKADITSKNYEKSKMFLENYEMVVKKINEVLERDRLRNFHSPVRGEEIMEIFNLKPSKAVGIIKSKIENEILEGNLPNDYDMVKSYILDNKDRFYELIKDYL